MAYNGDKFTFITQEIYGLQKILNRIWQMESNQEFYGTLQERYENMKSYTEWINDT